MMSDGRCLYCYQELAENGQEFHQQCSRKIFGRPAPPLLEYTSNQMLELAEKVVQSQSTVPGVQAKLSLGLQQVPGQNQPSRMTITGLWGNYILKPPTGHYSHLPEIEDLTMHLAEIAGIKTVPHTLIRLKSGELSYLTKRIDRDEKKKFHMEDMCQITERLTEAKYRGSYEQIGKALVQHSTNPGLDIIDFFEQVIFCFLTGNNDMHLKNFSLFKHPVRGYSLSPAYDLVAAELVVEGDEEELALTLNGKKRKINRQDFEKAMGRFELGPRVLDNIFVRFTKALPKWHQFINISFLPERTRQAYHTLLDKKVRQLGIS